MRKRMICFAAAAACLFGLAGCGSGSGTSVKLRRPMERLFSSGKARNSAPV